MCTEIEKQVPNRYVPWSMASLEQNFFKRMNNNMFGKKKENQWKYIDAKLVHTKKLRKL